MIFFIVLKVTTFNTVLHHWDLFNWVSFPFFFFFSITVKVEFRRCVIARRVIFRGFVSAWFHISCVQHCTSKGITSNLFHDYLNNLKSIIILHYISCGFVPPESTFYKSFVRATNSIPRGLILSTNMAEVSLFVNTTTQAVTCIKRKIKIQHFHIILSFSYSSCWESSFEMSQGALRDIPKVQVRAKLIH